MKTDFKLEWLAKCSKPSLGNILLEYRYLVHRFTPWLGLLISKTKYEKVRHLLLPNFIEESGDLNDNISHLQMLDNFILSSGIKNPDLYIPLKSTVVIEKWFYDLFDSGKTYEGLCVIGPSTEEISEQFLKPLLHSVRLLFSEKEIDYTYFDAHLSEMEVEHARCIEEAIRYMENIDKQLKSGKTHWVNEGLKKHIEFWNSMKDNFFTN